MPELQALTELRVERTNHTTGLYEAAFGAIIGDAQSIVDLGAGDSPFGTDYTRRGKEVFRVDPQYAERMPDDDHNALPHFANNLPLPDGSVDVAVSAFMFQHLPQGELNSTLAEAARVTRLATDEDPNRGYIAIFPVFAREKLDKAIAKAGLDDVAQVGYPDEEALHSRHPKVRYPTLVIRNTPELRKPNNDGKTRLDELAETIEASQALKNKSPAARFGAALRKATMRRTGLRNFDTRHV
jgi:hypothetical protein